MLKNIKLIVLLVLLTGCSFFQKNPEGTNFESNEFGITSNNVEFLRDLTYLNKEKKLIKNQEIFPEIYEIISNANEYILVDMFLFNSYKGAADSFYVDLSKNFADSLISKKKKNPEIEIDFITDPVNNVYSGDINDHVAKMKKNGINVIYTDLTELKDSNFLYSPFWRIFIQWFGNSSKYGLMPHPFSSEKKVTIRSYLNLLNFKANHRKTILADENDDYVCLITSANPHSGSSAHSNIAVKIKGDFAKELYDSEKVVAEFSKKKLVEFNPKKKKNNDKSENIIKLISEKVIYTQILNEINNTKKGDSISLGMFYLSERNIIKSLVKATERDVNVRIILDPNKDAFGYKKNGIPNRPVAEELFEDSKGKIKLRWYDTHSEQFHSKFLIINRLEGYSSISLGSANYTRRNLKNYNLETNVIMKFYEKDKLFYEIQNYFEEIWANKGFEYTVDYTKYRSQSSFKYFIYIIQETLGLGTF